MNYEWQKDHLTADEKAYLVLAQMTDDEKYAWLSGPMAIPMGDEPLPRAR